MFYNLIFLILFNLKSKMHEADIKNLNIIIKKLFKNYNQLHAIDNSLSSFFYKHQKNNLTTDNEKIILTIKQEVEKLNDKQKEEVINAFEEFLTNNKEKLTKSNLKAIKNLLNFIKKTNFTEEAEASCYKQTDLDKTQGIVKKSEIDHLLKKQISLNSKLEERMIKLELELKNQISLNINLEEKITEIEKKTNIAIKKINNNFESFVNSYNISKSFEYSIKIPNSNLKKQQILKELEALLIIKKPSREYYEFSSEIIKYFNKKKDNLDYNLLNEILYLLELFIESNKLEEKESKAMKKCFNNISNICEIK